jgi:hypothetical protein
MDLVAHLLLTANTSGFKTEITAAREQLGTLSGAATQAAAASTTMAAGLDKAATAQKSATDATAQASAAVTKQADLITGFGNALTKANGEMAKQAEQAARLKRELDPLASQMAKVSENLAQVNRLTQSGIIDSQTSAKFTKQLSEEHEKLARAMSGTSIAAKLTYTEQEILRAGGINLVQTLAAGGNAWTAFQTQLFQTLPAFPALTSALGLTASAIVGMVGGVALLAGGLAFSVIAQAQFASSQREIQSALQITAASSGATAGEINNFAMAAANSSRISVSSAREAATALAAQGSISIENIKRATAMVADYAAFTKKAPVEAAQALGQELAKPTDTLTKYADTLRGSVSDAQMQAVKDFGAVNNISAAQAVVLDVLEGRIKGLSENLSGGAKELDGWTRAASNAADVAGQFGQNLPLTSLSGKLGVPVPPPAPKPDNSKAEADARAIALGNSAGDLARSLDPTGEAVKNLTLKIDALSLAQENGAKTTEDLKAAEERLRNAKESLLSPTDKIVKAAENEARVLQAPIEQRAKLRAELAAGLAIAGQTILTAEQKRQVDAAGLIVTAQQTAYVKDANNQLQRQLANNAELAGKTPGQQAILKAGQDAYVKALAEGRSETDRLALAEQARAKAASDQNLAASNAATKATFDLKELGKVSDAYGVSQAAGLRADAERKGAMEAFTNAAIKPAEAAMRALADATAQEILRGNQQIISLNARAAAARNLADASKLGGAAEARAKIDNDIAAATASQRAALEALGDAADQKSIEQKQKLRDEIEKITSAIRAEAKANTDAAVNRFTLTQKDTAAVEQLKLEIAQQNGLITDPAVRLAQELKLQHLQDEIRIRNELKDATEEQRAAALREADAIAQTSVRTKLVQEQAKTTSQIWTNAANGIQSDLTSALQGAFEGGLKDGQSVADNLVSIFKKAGAQILSALTIQATIGNIQGLGASGGGLPSLFGSSGTGGSSGPGLLSQLANLGGSSSISSLFGASSIANPGAGLTPVTAVFNPQYTGQVANAVGGGGFFTNIGNSLTNLGGLGAGLAGFGVGQALNSILGGKQTGGLVGGTVGGIAGLAIGGPIGAAIGAALGSVLGGLFGPAAHKEAGQANIVLGADGKLNLGNVGVGATYTADDKAKLSDSASQAIDALNKFADTYKLKFEGTTNRDFNAYLGLGKDADGAKSEADLVKMILNGTEFRSGAGAVGTLKFASDDPVVKQILAATKARDTGKFADLEADLQFADTYKSIIKISDGTGEFGQQATQASQAIDAMAKYFDDATTKAKDLGLSIEKFADAETKAKKAFGQGYIDGIQDQLDQLSGKGELKTLRSFAKEAKAQLEDLDLLFSKGFISQSQLDAARATAEELQRREAVSVLAGLSNSQLDDVIAAFANDTSVFGRAVIAVANQMKSGVSVLTGAGIDAQGFKDKTQTPLDERLRNAQSALDPRLKGDNDATILAAKRDLETRNAITQAIKDGANQAQVDFIRSTYATIYAYEDMASAANKAQTAMSNAVQTVENLGKTINDYLNKSAVDANSGKSPTDILAETKRQYEEQMALAQGGNADALSSITTYAEQYRNAITKYYGSSAEGQGLQQSVLSGLGQLTKTPGLAASIANNALRNQGDSGIKVDNDGNIYLNGRRIGFSQNPNAGTDIGAFKNLAQGVYDAKAQNRLTNDFYNQTVGSRDQILRGYSDKQLQAVSDQYYGGTKVTGLDQFLDYLHRADQVYLNTHTRDGRDDSQGGLGGDQGPAGGNRRVASLVAAANDNTGLSAAWTAAEARLKELISQSHLDLTGPDGVTSVLSQVGTRLVDQLTLANATLVDVNRSRDDTAIALRDMAKRFDDVAKVLEGLSTAQQSQTQILAEYGNRDLEASAQAHDLLEKLTSAVKAGVNDPNKAAA